MGKTIRYQLSIAFLITCLSATAQMPEFKVDGKKDSSIYLEKYKVNVKVTGNIAYTTIEMQICNRSQRILEAELNFTLPDGINVSNYALDINGKLREAVPVEKEKGTQVFESIERRRVDPGLLEKTAGNSFRTRIYPVNPGNCRSIRIGYTQELIFSSSNALTYNLPLNFDEAVNHFSVDFKVFSKTNPEMASDCNTGMQFTKAEEVYNSHTEKTNFTPNGNFMVIIPKMSGGDEVQMQKVNGNYYFLLNSYLQPKQRTRNIGNNIGIIWDASFSGRYRNHTKELELLDSLFQYRKNASVQVFTISNNFKKIAALSISNGDISALKKTLSEIIYDGAGELNKINTANINADEFYLFSDGISNFSDAEPQFGKQPLFCINAAVNSNYHHLKNWSNKTGGQYINLNELYIGDAMRAINSQPYQLIGIKGLLNEVYPALPVKLNANVCLAGISFNPSQQLTLQFGYGNEITEEKQVQLNAAKQPATDLDIEKAWVQKKISFLESSAGDNKNAVAMLGKKYGIVTEGTSLIVLEQASDYVRYKIDPPAELKAAYDSILQETAAEKKEERDNILHNAITYINDLREWSKEKPVVKIKPAVIRARPVPTPVQQRPINVDVRRPANVIRDTSGGLRTLNGRITDDTGTPVAFASVFIKGATDGVVADASGNYRLRVYNRDVLQIAAVGFQTLDIDVASKTTLNTILVKTSANLEEVVVTAAFTTRRRNVTSSVSTVKANDISSTPVYDALEGKVSGVQVNKNGGAKAGEQVIIRGASSLPQGNKPLLIVDGKVSDRLPAATEITSMEVLKDFAVTSAFGSMASNGVILIKTKNIPVQNLPADSAATVSAKMLIKEWNPDREYLKEIEQAGAGGYYAKYLQLREQYIATPVFYFDMANFFFLKGDKKTGLIILSNLAELNLEDAGLFKMLGYKLKELGEYEKEAYVYKKVLLWRPHEPQSFRDYALALADAGYYQQAVDTLYAALTHVYEDDIMEDYEGIEEIISTEINQLVNKYHLNTSRIDKRILLNNPVDVRVVLNWNMNDTDIDLWVTGPDGEKCYYENKKTKMGGRISDDFTEGYGPEQFLLRKAMKGKYKIEINYYGDDQKKIAGPTTIMAEVYMHYGMPNETKKIITIQMKSRDNGEFLVGNIEF